MEEIREALEKALLYKKVTKIKDGVLYLENGDGVEFVETFQDCCAGANGEWVNLNNLNEALITCVQLENVETDDNWCDSRRTTAKLVLYYENEQLATSELEADAGNGGYYGSTLGLEIDGNFITNLITESGVAYEL